MEKLSQVLVLRERHVLIPVTRDLYPHCAQAAYLSVHIKILPCLKRFAAVFTGKVFSSRGM